MAAADCKVDDFLTNLTGSLTKQLDASDKRKEIWKNLDFFCLDNSIRESTVAQVSSHTLANKQKIYQETKKCGFKDIIVASFSSMTRVDDDFVKWLQATESPEDFQNFHSFSEVTIGVELDDEGQSIQKYNDGETEQDLPDGMKKNKLYGLVNTFFEADFASEDVEWGKTWTVEDECKLLEKRIRWVKDNISKTGKNLLNMRDFPTVMKNYPERMLSIIKFLSKMPEEYRLFGLAYEDPMGEFLPKELAMWTRAVRDTMTQYGWINGKLINHVHGKWGYKDAATMECLANGSDGMWAGTCEEGAAVGHASTTVAILNLIRWGNEKVTKKYNCTQLRKTAIEVTKLTTEALPHPKQPIYGERATDLVFGFIGIGDFDVAEFFGFEAENRITTMASVDMIIDRLEKLFGEDEQFNDEIAGNMREQMLEDLRNGFKNEYHSPYGIAMLFDRSGGELTEQMKEVLTNVDKNNEFHKAIKDELHAEWLKYSSTNTGSKKTAVAAKSKKKKKNKKNKNKNKNKDKAAAKGDDDDTADEDILSFDQFYHGFMQPYFGCYRCSMTKKALQNIDMNDDLTVDWDEFSVYIDWALHEYNDYIGNASQAVELAFEKGIIPAMRDDANQYAAKLFETPMSLVEPENYGDHTASVIFLHGIGDYDEYGRDGDYWFGKFRASESVTKKDGKFSHIRFVCPTANQLSISDKNGSPYNAWFDVNNQGNNICDDGQQSDENLRMKLGLTSDDVKTSDVDSKEDANNTTTTTNSGLSGNYRKIKKLIRKEIRKYKIESSRVMICGFNQGSLLALKASLEMGKEFAGVVCLSGLLTGESKDDFDKLIKLNKKKQEMKKEMPIYWYDKQKYVRVYDYLGKDHSKKCCDYLKSDCGLNAMYQEYDDSNQHEFEKVLRCIEKRLPKEYTPKVKKGKKGGKKKNKNNN